MRGAVRGALRTAGLVLVLVGVAVADPGRGSTVTTAGLRTVAGATPDQPAAGSGPSCNPRASLRPDGPLPEPGRMPPGSSMAGIVERGELVVGVDQNTYLLSSRSESGELVGFEIDMVRDIAAAIFGQPGPGDPPRVLFRPISTNDRLEFAQQENIDMVVSAVTITCGRRQELDFSGVYLEAGRRVLVDRRLPARGVEDLTGKRVCAARGSTALEQIVGTPGLVPVGVLSTTDCLAELQLGAVDAISTDDAILAGIVAQDPRTTIVGPRLSEEPYGIAIKKSTPDLVRFVNAVLEQRAANGAWTASYGKWLSALQTPPPAPPRPEYEP